MIHQLNIMKIIKKDYKKKSRGRHQSLSKIKKRINMAAIDTKVYQKMKSKSLLSIGKHIIK